MLRVRAKMGQMFRSRADWLAFSLCILFIGLGSLWISECGIQSDEALFAGGIYPPYRPDLVVFGKARPLMLMDHVGALKSYLWKPLVRNLGPSAATVRIPAVLLGGVTVWWFYLLMQRTLGIRAALAGAALLATDATFVLTTRWDWGPLVLQHLLTVGGVLSIVRYLERNRLAWLATAFLAFGLAAWDKALFFWVFSGLAMASLVIFPRTVVQHSNVRALVVAAASFAVGASPVIAHNITHPLITFQQGAWSRPEDIGTKTLMLRATFNGSGMFAGLVREQTDGPLRAPDDALKKAWVRLTDLAGAPRESVYVHLAAASLLLSLFVRRSPAGKASTFVCVFCAIAWLQMVFTPGAGGSPHHVGLLWPFPHLAMGAVLAEASTKLRRFGGSALACVIAVACLSSIAVIGTTYRNMLRNGGVKEWTDAIYPAAEALPGMRPSFVCFLDWGFYDNVRLLTRGRLPLCNGIDPAQDRTSAKQQLDVRDVVYMTHTAGNEVNPGVTDRLTSFAVGEGYTKADRRVFYDYNGRPMIEVFKLFKPQLASPGSRQE